MCSRHAVEVNTERTLTAAGRDRALALRRRLTTCSAFCGMTAVAAFGFIAERDVAGHAAVSATTTTTASRTTSGSGAQSTASPKKTSSSASSASATSAPTATGSVSSGTSSSAYVVTGGS